MDFGLVILNYPTNKMHSLPLDIVDYWAKALVTVITVTVLSNFRCKKENKPYQTNRFSWYIHIDLKLISFGFFPFFGCRDAINVRHLYNIYLLKLAATKKWRSLVRSGNLVVVGWRFRGRFALLLVPARVLDMRSPFAVGKKVPQLSHVPEECIFLIFWLKK